MKITEGSLVVGALGALAAHLFARSDLWASENDLGWICHKSMNISNPLVRSNLGGYKLECIMTILVEKVSFLTRNGHKETTLIYFPISTQLRPIKMAIFDNSNNWTDTSTILPTCHVHVSATAVVSPSPCHGGWFPHNDPLTMKSNYTTDACKLYASLFTV